MAFMMGQPEEVEAFSKHVTGVPHFGPFRSAENCSHPAATDEPAAVTGLILLHDLGDTDDLAFIDIHQLHALRVPSQQ